MRLRDVFGGTRAPRNPQAVAEIKACVLRQLGLGEDCAVTISEIVCPDPGCPDLETVILIMRRGERTRALKIRKPLAAVTELDVRESLVLVSEAGPR